MGVRLNDHGKLILLTLILLVTAVLASIHVLDADSVRLVLAVELGYITGNGVLAVRNKVPSPVLAPSSSSSSESAG